MSFRLFCHIYMLSFKLFFHTHIIVIYIRAKFNWELRKSILMKRIKVKTKGMMMIYDDDDDDDDDGGYISTFIINITYHYH